MILGPVNHAHKPTRHLEANALEQESKQILQLLRQQKRKLLALKKLGKLPPQYKQTLKELKGI